jgi:quinol monooxygenase YgiN
MTHHSPRFRWLLRSTLALLSTISVLASAQVHAEPGGSLTFIEVSVAARGHAANVLRDRAGSLREHTSPSAQIILLQEIARPERFALVELESPTVATHGAQEMNSLPGSLEDELIAPLDRRANREFEPDMGSTGAKIDTRANVYVIAHLDLALPAPPDRARAEAALHQFATAARQSDGNLGFAVWQQTERPNHFNLISGWLSDSQFRAFAATRAARDFRRIVGPLLGSPYDERLFRRVD